MDGGYMIYDIDYNPNKGRIRAFIGDMLIAALSLVVAWAGCVIAWAIWGV